MPLTRHLLHRPGTSPRQHDPSGWPEYWAGDVLLPSSRKILACRDAVSAAGGARRRCVRPLRSAGHKRVDQPPGKL